MPRAALPRPLALAAARRLWLRAQRLDTPDALRRRPGGDPRRGRAPRLRADRHHQRHRALAPPHPLVSRIPGYRRADLAHALSVDKSVFEYWAHALAYIPTRDYRFFIADMKRHRAQPLGLVRQRHARRPPPRRRPGPPRGRAHHPRHRRRRARRQGPPLGQPQAVEARAAARLLRRHPDDLRPRRHGEDLRAHRPPLRLAAAPAHGDRGPDARLPARPRAARPGRRQPRLGLLHGRAAQEGDGGADRGPRPPPQARAGRDRRPEAALGDAGGARRAAAGDRHRPPPLALRPAGHPAQAARRPSSATTTPSRPTSPPRNGGSATSPCRSSSATASPPPSTSRPTAPAAGS